MCVCVCVCVCVRAHVCVFVERHKMYGQMVVVLMFLSHMMSMVLVQWRVGAILGNGCGI